MGKKYVIDEETLTDIADGLRETINDLDAKYKPEDMRQKINDVYNTGEEDGFNYGYVTGLDEGWEQGSLSGYNAGYLEGEENGIELGKQQGYNEGYEAGKQKEWSDFWDAFQNYGNKKKYDRAFYNHDSQDYNPWNKKTIKPKYDLIPTSADRMFYRVTGISNLEEHFQELGIKLDFSKSTSLALAFCYGSWVTFPTLDCSNATIIEGICNYCYYLETIEKWIMSENVTVAGKCFVECTKLKNIIVEGVIAVSISFSNSPLIRESILSILTHLKNYSGTGKAGAYTITLKDSCKTLMAEQGEIEELGDKTYDQYITDIGWNLA